MLVNQQGFQQQPKTIKIIVRWFFQVPMEGKSKLDTGLSITFHIYWKLIKIDGLKQCEINF